MLRSINIHLREWVDHPHRKPLLIRGARQVGKTHAIRALGSLFDNMVEINFERNIHVRDIFNQELDPKTMCLKLSILTDKPIIPGKTLLFLDEIQQVPRAITALRYFYEELPELHVIAAGSLVDFAIEKIGVPVGRISFIYMHPMSFVEFLIAGGHHLWVEEILHHDVNNPLVSVIHDKIMEQLGIYMAIGGMPEAVKYWFEHKNYAECIKIHQSLIDTYRQDFEKYAKNVQLKYLNLIFEKIPSLLGKSIKYSHFSIDHRKRELEPCLDLLIKANVVQKIRHSSGNGIPLGAEASFDKFKVNFIDIALSQAMLGMDHKAWFLKPQAEFVNKGAITESFVGQELLAYANPYHHPELFYWHRMERGSLAEVDYLFQSKQVIPIEAKGGYGSSLKSIKMFLETHSGSPYGIRFSAHNYSVHEKINSYPLYAIAGACQNLTSTG